MSGISSISTSHDDVVDYTIEISEHGDEPSLELYIFNEIMYIHTKWLLTKLYCSELNLDGGRFALYDKEIIDNTISLEIFSPNRKQTHIFPVIFNWLGNNATGKWSVRFDMDKPVQLGAMGKKTVKGKALFSFENTSDAVLCKLIFA